MGSQIGSFKILQDLAPGKRGRQAIAQAISLDISFTKIPSNFPFLFWGLLCKLVKRSLWVNIDCCKYYFFKNALRPYAHLCSSTYCILNSLWSLFAKLQHSWYIINRYKVQIYYSLFNIMVYINITLKAKKIQWIK